VAVTYTRVHAIPYWSNSNTTGAALSVTVAPTNIGDLMVAVVLNQGGTSVASLSGGGVSSWSRVGSPWTDAEATPSTMEWWIGTVTATGSSSISVTWNAAVGSHFNEITVQDFHAVGGTGVWTAEATGNQSNPSSSGTVTYPTLAATNQPEIYMGYASTPNAISVGSPSPAGFVVDLTNGNNCCINGLTYAGTAVTHSVTINSASWAVGITIYQPAAPLPPSMQDPATPPGRRSPMSRFVVPDAQPQIIVPVILTNSADGITPSGTVLTGGSGGNTGGASGSFLDTVTIGSGATLQSDSAHAHSGSFSIQCATGATAATSFMTWQASMAAANWSPIWFRLYVFQTAATTAVSRLMSLNDAVPTICGQLRITAANVLSVTNAAGTQVGLGTLALPTNAWFRIEGWATPGSSGQIHYDLYTTSPDAPLGSTPDETITSAATNMGAMVGNARIGQSGATQSNYGPYWFDDIGISNVGPLGPVVAAATPVTLVDAAAATEKITQKLEDLQDNFPGSSVDTTKWTAYNNATVASSTLTLTDTASSTLYSGIQSNVLYDLTGSYLLAHCTNGGLQATSTQAMILVQISANNTAALIINNGNLIAQSQVAGSYVNQGTIAWVGATMSWLRIRESGGTIFWDYSADGLTWTNLASFTKPVGWDITQVQAVVQEGAFATTDPQATSTWQSINLPPSTFTLTDRGAAVEALASPAAVPVADVAAGTEALVVTATVPLAEVAAGAEALTVSAAVSLADAAGAVDALASLSATVPVADTAGASEALTLPAKTLPIADTAGAADTLAIPAETIPLADTGAAAEASAATVTLPLADSAGGSEVISAAATLSVTDQAGAVEAMVSGMPVALADVAGASDQVAVTASVPLGDAAAAAEALTVTATAGIADAAGAAEAAAASVTVPLAETGAGSDAPAISATLPLADRGAGVEAQAIAMPVSLAEAGGAADTGTASSTVPLADTAAAAEAQLIGVAPAEVAAAAESLTITATLPLAEVAGAADALVLGAPVTLAEVAGSIEALAVSVAVPVADQGASAEACAAAAAVPAGDQAGAADAIAVVAGANPQLPDAAGAAEALGAAVASPVTDAGAASEVLTGSVTAGAADRAGAADATGVSAILGLPDAGAAQDALATAQAAQPVLPDAAGGTEALSVSVVATSADRAAASDVLVTGALQAVSFTDTGAAGDRLLYSIPPSEPQPLWTAAPAALRWHAGPVDRAWQVAPATTRWETSPSPTRWAAHAMPARWVILVAEFEPIASVSQEMINVSWTSDLGGSDVDPTTGPMPVQFAFPVSSGDQHHPASPVTWFTGTWLPDLGNYKGYIAQCSVGPTALGGLVQLAPGAYDVWSWVQTGTENPRKFAGVQVVY